MHTPHMCIRTLWCISTHTSKHVIVLSLFLFCTHTHTAHTHVAHSSAYAHICNTHTCTHTHHTYIHTHTHPHTQNASKVARKQYCPGLCNNKSLIFNLVVLLCYTLRTDNDNRILASCLFWQKYNRLGLEYLIIDSA